MEFPSLLLTSHTPLPGVQTPEALFVRPHCSYPTVKMCFPHINAENSWKILFFSTIPEVSSWTPSPGLQNINTKFESIHWTNTDNTVVVETIIIVTKIVQNNSDKIWQTAPFIAKIYPNIILIIWYYMATFLWPARLSQ